MSQETILSCSSLDTFIDLFFADEASYTISKYQKEIVGDKEVHFSKWKRKNPSFPLIFHRNISFIHPLKNTVGPSQAKTSRKQQFQLFGNFGMTLQNLTIVEGIPAADCFQVEDRWTIETLALPGGQWALKIAVSFQICFVKRTIFKAIIQKNIRQETKTWFQGYASMVQRALTEGVVTPEPLFSIAPVKSDALETHTNVLVENPSSTSPLELVPKVVTIILVSVLVLQLFHVQRSVASLNHQMEQMKTQNLELTTALKELVSKQCIVDLK